MRQVRWLGLLVLFVLPACARGGGYDEHDAGGGGGRLDAMVVQLMDAGSQPTPDAGVVVPPPVDAGGCVPSCVGRTCGDDGCGGSCGTCTTGTCEAGTCSCTPNCVGRTCGDDGCGGSC
ncbi:MAG: hypothetical protein KC619_16025, partial [Myxococcales bacterium]|nr:hypothetical protein [Myxococcales bacterium]